MADTPLSPSSAGPPRGWLERFRQRVSNHWLMQEGRLPSIGRELAFAVEDIRHKVVEEGMFGRQVTPSTFPHDDPPPALASRGGAGIHGRHDGDAPQGGPDVHGNGNPSPVAPGDDDKQARREKFYAMCREVASGHPGGPGIDRTPDVAPPAR